MAASAKKIFAGEKLSPFKTVSVDHALWLIVMGEGFGKQQYRFVHFFIGIRSVSNLGLLI